MTNKRFTSDGLSINDGEHRIGLIQASNILNILYEDNQSKQKLLHLAANKIDILLEENEHIKHTIKTMMENERTELGRSVLKQLWEAIQ